MSEEGEREASGQVKTCPGCGGTWPAVRPRCLACGANLAGVPAHAPEDTAGAGFDWRWLDAMGSEPEEAGAPSSGSETEDRPGCLARIFPRPG